MRIELSNREWTFLRLLCIARLPTITVIVRYTIFEVDNENELENQIIIISTIIFVYVCYPFRLKYSKCWFSTNRIKPNGSGYSSQARAT